MKTTRKLIAVTVLGLGLFAAGALQAQDNPLVIQINMAVRVQAASTTNHDVATFKANRLRVGTKELLAILGAATTNDFTGASLVLANRHLSVFEVVRGTNVLGDVSRFFSMGGSTNYLITGTASSKSTRYNVMDSWIKTFTFDDGRGNSFSLSGIETDMLRAGAPDNQGHQKFSETTTLNGVGEGQIGGNFGLFMGTIKMSRKSTG